MVYYESIDVLLDMHAIERHIPYLRLPYLKYGMTEIHVYVGSSGDHQLGNLRRFLDYNDVGVVNVGTFYSTAIVVGFDGKEEVGIPASMFPFMVNYYGVTDASFFLQEPPIIPFSLHVLMAVCGNCKGHHHRCVRRGLECVRCIKSGIKCIASSEEHTRRNKEFRQSHRKALDTFCALHQYTINLFARSRAEGVFPAKVVVALGKTLSGIGAPCKEHLVDSILFYGTSYQHVRIVCGVVEIVRDYDMEDIWGFDMGSGPCIISPHFGMQLPEYAHGFLDAAFSAPGKVHYRDMCLLSKSFTASSKRIMIMATVYNSEHVELIIGWRSPLEE